MQYRVVLLMVPYFDCLRDVAEMFSLALNEAGLPAQVQVMPPSAYTLRHGTQDILLGAHAAPEIWDRVPPRTLLSSLGGFAGTPPPIVYQTENLCCTEQDVVPQWWRRQALRAITWDYSAVNARLLGTHHVPLSYVRPFVRPLVQQPFPDIDVLFYGSCNERRSSVLDQMHKLGLRTQIVFGAFGEGLDQLIARSKVILNVHFYDPGLFESVRVLPLVHRGVCVLGEQSRDNEGMDICLTVPYADLAKTAQLLVDNDNYIVHRASDHVRLRRRQPLSEMLVQALRATADPVDPHPAPVRALHAPSP